MRNVDERNAQLFVHGFQFQLHFFAHFQIERAERLVEKQNFRLVNNGARDGDTLLLSAGKGGNGALFETGKVYRFQRVFHFFFDFRLGKRHKFCFRFAVFIHVRRFHAF